MIKNIHLRNTLGMLILGATAGSSLPAFSATIIYPGTELKPVIVNGFTKNDCLFPEGSSSGNEVHVQDGGDAIKGSVFGNDPSLTGADAVNNTVVMEGGKIDGVGCFIYGGFSDTGNAIGNTVEISGGDYRQVNGGGSFSGDAIGNTVIVTDGNIFGIYGGTSSTGRAAGNAVTVSGGYIDQGISGGYADQGDAMGNSVTISGGVIKYGSVSGGVSNYYGNATGNSVTVSGGSIGGYVWGGDASYGEARGNSVVISGGSVRRDVYGGHTGTSTSDPQYSDAVGNSVTILGGYIGQGVYGGWSYGGNSTGNTVTISGGEITQVVVGGAGASATSNTVILKGSSIQFSEGIIYGGYSWDASGDAVTGNTLILDDFSGSVGSFRNFERVVLNFSSVPAPGVDAPILILQGDENTLKGASLSISIGNCGNLAPGQSFSLIRANDGVDLAANGLTLENSSISSVAMRYDLCFSIDANLVNATVVSSSLNPQTKSLSEGRIVPLALAGQAQDLVASLGVDHAVMAAMQRGFSSGAETFFAMAGGRSTYDTGSHVDLSGFSLLAGVSSSMPRARSVVVGAFLETGWGNYSSHNSFEDAPSVRGSGDASYSGGGMLVRWDMSGAGLRGVSLETSFRAGSAEENYSSGDLTDGLGRSAWYDLSSPYYGGHVGAAFSRNLTQTVTMSSYARFLWNRVGEERAIIGGDEVGFQALTSYRLQGGARFHYHATATVRPYAGLGYEWECSGTSRAATYGQEIAAPSLRGGTGTVEAGALIRLTERKPVFLDVGVKGYAGKREGVSGSVQLRMAF